MGSGGESNRGVCLTCQCGEVHASYVAEVAKTSGGPPGGSQITRILANSATAHARRFRQKPYEPSGTKPTNFSVSAKSWM